jgi:ketosteroid isomerase-like protein
LVASGESAEAGGSPDALLNWSYAPAIAQTVPPEVLERMRVQERFDCWNRGELDLMLEMYAEDAVFDLSAVFTDVAPVRGHQDMLRYWKELQETWGGGIRTEPLEFFDLGHGRYVLDLRIWGTGTRSGVEVDQRFAFLYDFRRDGKVVYAKLFSDVPAAIAASQSSVSEIA